jgi:hypothetical protein
MKCYYCEYDRMYKIFGGFKNREFGVLLYYLNNGKKIISLMPVVFAPGISQQSMPKKTSGDESNIPKQHNTLINPHNLPQ